MQPNEVAKLLTMVASVDDRIDPDEMRVVMWYETLNRKMTFEFARDVVVEHYATKRTVIMPADLNEKWKPYSAKLFMQQQDELLALEKEKATAMPETIKQQLELMFRKH